MIWTQSNKKQNQHKLVFCDKSTNINKLLFDLTIMGSFAKLMAYEMIQNYKILHYFHHTSYHSSTKIMNY
jgi:hypothetical protein